VGLWGSFWGYALGSFLHSYFFSFSFSRKLLITYQKKKKILFLASVKDL
jgi:hypothetical protein